MQNDRDTRDPVGPDRSSYPQPGSALLKRTHAASSAQPFPRQLSCVQYPPGWDVSQRRSPRMEQSVETWHSSPISGVRVNVVSQAGASGPSYSGPDGMYYLYNIPPGHYTLQVWDKPDQPPLQFAIEVYRQPWTDIAPIQVRPR